MSSAEPGGSEGLCGRVHGRAQTPELARPRCPPRPLVAPGKQLVLSSGSARSPRSVFLLRWLGNCGLIRSWFCFGPAPLRTEPAQRTVLAAGRPLFTPVPVQ